MHSLRPRCHEISTQSVMDECGVHTPARRLRMSMPLRKVPTKRPNARAAVPMNSATGYNAYVLLPAFDPFDKRRPRATPKSLLGRRGSPVPTSSSSETAHMINLQSLLKARTPRTLACDTDEHVAHCCRILTSSACRVVPVQSRGGAQVRAPACLWEPELQRHPWARYQV